MKRTWRWTSISRMAGLVCCLTLLSGTAFAEQDPWEGLNRKVFQFNEWTDSKILRPTAKAYDKWLPRPIRSGVGNVFDNVFTPAVALNQLLQGKPRRSLTDTGRFLLNSTLGLGGLLDVASKVGMPKHEEDFGQTFAVWGAASGNYVVLPFLGPSNVRDSVGLAVSALVNPIRLISPVEDRVAVTALYVLDLRADLIGVDELVTGDKYLFRRDTYLQRRDFLINDGVGDDDPFADDGFDDFEDE